MRPFGATPSPAAKRSPDPPGATSVGVVHLVRSLAAAEVRYTRPRPFTMSEYATYIRLSATLYAGAGYEPGPRKAPPLMLKQSGGNRQTGLLNTPSWNGVLHVWP